MEEFMRQQETEQLQKASSLSAMGWADYMDQMPQK
jgi:hypothetical protein